MKIQRFDRVKKRVEHTFWDGYVLGPVYRLDGSKLIVCERSDRMLFMALEHELELVEKYNPGDSQCVRLNVPTVEANSQNLTSN